MARSIMRRKRRYVIATAALLLALAVPVAWLQLTPGATAGIPQSPQSVRGLNVLKAALGPGAIAPAQVLVDTGKPSGVSDPAVQAAIGRLVAATEVDPEVAAAYYLPGGRFVDSTARYAQVIVATRHEYGAEEAQAFVDRLRGSLIPAAGFPAGSTVLAGGASPQGVDFLHVAYGAFPWLVAAVLLLTYLLLMRAFRSLILPLKAVVLNLLSVAAAYGALVLVFRFGLGHDLLGLYQFPQIEGWIPIFLFAMLFGLSMDYEVFLVSRMREEHVHGAEPTQAVVNGFAHGARVVTAAAIIMISVFSGFVLSSEVLIKSIGFALAFGVLVDAFVVRMTIVPAVMSLLDKAAWWLPRWLDRLLPKVDVEGEGLAAHTAAAPAPVPAVDDARRPAPALRG